MRRHADPMVHKILFQKRSNPKRADKPKPTLIYIISMDIQLTVGDAVYFQGMQWEISRMTDQGLNLKRFGKSKLQMFRVRRKEVISTWVSGISLNQICDGIFV